MALEDPSASDGLAHHQQLVVAWNSPLRCGWGDPRAGGVGHVLLVIWFVVSIEA